MKRKILFLFIINMVLLIFNSCVSLTDKSIPQNQVETVTIIGKVQTTFTSWQPLYIIMKNNIQTKAYSRLLEQAKNNFGENVDVKNIKINGTLSGYNFWVNPLVAFGSFFAGGYPTGDINIGIITGIAGLAVTGDFQKITATGDVILLNSQRQSQTNRTNTTGIDGAIIKASIDLINDLPENTRIAVINISSNNGNLSANVVDEIEYQLVFARKFTIVDRNALDTIRREQNFQMSGEVSDSSAVSIGQMLGANIVITGSITEVGTNQRLSIRALDVKTAQIIAMVRETF